MATTAGAWVLARGRTVWAATCGGRRANGVRRRRQPAREDGTRGTGLRLESASTVPCHCDQGTTHGPAVGGVPRRASVLLQVGAPRWRHARRRVRAQLARFNFTWPYFTGFSSRIFNRSDPR
jgi:hypothetical protein